MLRGADCGLSAGREIKTEIPSNSSSVLYVTSSKGFWLAEVGNEGQPGSFALGVVDDSLCAGPRLAAWSKRKSNLSENK